MNALGHFINGAMTPPSAALIDSIDPATGVAWCQISRGDRGDADTAMIASRAAFETGPWARMTAADRAACLDRIADRLQADWHTLVADEVRDNGKRIGEVEGQFSALHTWFRPCADQARALADVPQPIAVAGATCRLNRVPFGPVVAITPWNSPLMILAWKLAPALAAGNTVVVKPSEHASVSTLNFARMLQDAGLPAGVLNVVTGTGPDVGDALVRHPATRLVTFTGSDAGGRAVAAGAAANVVPTTLELGGKSPQIVFDDADPDTAVNGILSGIFLSNGQSCVAGSRLIVQANMKETVLERLIARARSLRMGDPMDRATQIGPLANEPHLRKVRSMIDRAKADGARCLLDGAASGDGFFVGPTIFDQVTPDMQIWKEEVFGPVLAVATFDSEDDALTLANDTDYGLAAGVWTEDAERGQRVAGRIRAGTVYVNHYRSVDPAAPIGGMGRSGYGRELGSDAIDHFLQVRSIWTGTAPVTDPFSA